jgi:pantoate--beta-alanine ligase
MSSIPIVRAVADLRTRVRTARTHGAHVALVPTMGALHAGHLSLVERAAVNADFVVASIFVNPTQFAPNEDFQAYPRDEAHDVALLASAGCQLVYAPSLEIMYPAGYSTTISVTGVAAPLEGAHRPTHFAGVATIVTKLLIQAGPDFAVFGEKDYQQLQVIRRLARDLDLPTEINCGPTVRDPDGLALSSRNAYLSASQRQAAPALHRALKRAAGDITTGSSVSDVETAAVASLLEAGFDAVDYFEARGPDDLERLGPGPVTGPVRLLTAARLGRTRLIDNLAVTPTRPPIP